MIQSLKSDLEERTTLLTETEVDLENTKTELKESGSRVSALEENSATLSSEKAALQAQVEEHLSLIKQLNVSLLCAVCVFSAGLILFICSDSCVQVPMLLVYSKANCNVFRYKRHLCCRFFNGSSNKITTLKWIFGFNS